MVLLPNVENVAERSGIPVSSSRPLIARSLYKPDQADRPWDFEGRQRRNSAQTLNGEKTIYCVSNVTNPHIPAVYDMATPPP